MALFSMSPSTPIGGDCTCGYYVRLYRKCTVGELVREILSRTDEWGGITIKYDKNVGGKICVSNRYGECDTSRIEHLFDKEVKKVNASGGWTNMDWYITI